MTALERYSRLPDAELTPELIGHRLDTMAELPRSVFLLRHLDGLEVAAIGARHDDRGRGARAGARDRRVDLGCLTAVWSSAGLRSRCLSMN